MKRIFYVKLKGQSLVTIMIFVIVAIIISTAAIVITVTNSLSSSAFDLGTQAYYASESGLENGLIRLLRDKTYLGETMSIGNNTATIAVSGTDPSYKIISTGRAGNFLRKIQVTLTYTNSVMTITSWKEIE